MAASIREKKTVALKRMLNFNVPLVKSTAGEPVWKVLIYDRFGQDIIWPLLSVKELRDMGVTLHLLLHSDRDTIPDVPVIYFVMPTEENVDRICQDLRTQLYESYYLNFISAISCSKLEDIASAALTANTASHVSKDDVMSGELCMMGANSHAVPMGICSYHGQLLRLDIIIEACSQCLEL